MEVDDHMYEACTSIFHEWTSKVEGKNVKEDIDVEKKQLFMKKEMQNKEIMRGRKNIKLGSQQYKKNNYEMAIEVNDELKLNVYEQLDYQRNI